MNSVKTYAKINLTLDVTEKRDDGYHNIDSIFEEISLYDTVSIDRTNSGEITVSCSKSDIPCDRRNTVYKAAEAFFGYTGIQNNGINISIEKNIPNEAGMGGGSTNAAGALFLLNKIFSAGLSKEELIKISTPVGADIPFFIEGGLCHVCGIGDIITPLPSLPLHYIVIAKGQSGISTPQAYREIDSLSDIPHHNTEKILSCIAEKDIYRLMNNCLNTFELTALPDDIANIKSVMKKHNTISTHMTGSGAAVFGIFTDKDAAQNAYLELKRNFAFAGVYTNICKE